VKWKMEQILSHDVFHHLLAHHFDTDALLKIDNVFCGGRRREDWLEQLRKLPQIFWERTVLATGLTHDKVRWLISRGITAVRSISLEKGPFSTNLQVPTFLQCNWSELQCCDLRPPKRTSPGRFIASSSSTFYERVHLQNIDDLTLACGPRLQKMFLVGSSLAEDLDAALDLISLRCPLLSVLVVEGCGRALSDASLASLSRLDRLEHLTLHGAACITDTGVAALLAIPALGPDQAEAEAEASRECRLTHVNFNQAAAITPAAVEALAAACSRLTSIYLADCPALTDSCIVKLAKSNPGLETVVLSRCYLLGDTAVLALAKHCRGLLHLDIKGCVNVSSQALSRVARALPLLAVTTK